MKHRKVEEKVKRKHPFSKKGNIQGWMRMYWLITAPIADTPFSQKTSEDGIELNVLTIAPKVSNKSKHRV